MILNWIKKRKEKRTEIEIITAIETEPKIPQGDEDETQTQITIKPYIPQREEKVLFVDGNHNGLDTIKNLTTQFGMQTYEAKNLEDALEIALHERPEIIVEQADVEFRQYEANELATKVKQIYMPTIININSTFSDRLVYDFDFGFSQHDDYNNSNGHYQLLLATILAKKELTSEEDLVAMIEDYNYKKFGGILVSFDFKYENIKNRYTKSDELINELNEFFPDCLKLPKENEKFQKVYREMIPGFCEHELYTAFSYDPKIEAFIDGINTRDLDKINEHKNSFQDHIYFIEEFIKNTQYLR